MRTEFSGAGLLEFRSLQNLILEKFRSLSPPYTLTQQLGGAVTLQCICLAGSQVMWSLQGSLLFENLRAGMIIVYTKTSQ